MILESLESNTDNVDVIYLDFAKAFDKVDFCVTLEKLESLGIRGKVGKWIRSFLMNREQSVVVEGISSLPTRVKSGVPQGSVLGPILFLILIGDIDKNVKSSFVSSFADDTRAGRQVSNESDVTALQTDLDSIYQWSDDNNMTFNDDKFELLRYGDNSELKEATSYLNKDGIEIERKSNAKDLGVMMSDSGQFRDHIVKICQTANRVTAWILRTFKTRDEILMLTLFKSLVLPHLEYCCQLWNPTKAKDIQLLENIQRCFTRKINGCSGLDYWDRLKSLKLFSLERRRERYSIIYVWKMIEGLVPNIGLNCYESGRRGRLCNIPILRRKASMRTQSLLDASFKVRGPKLFNVVPAHIRSITKCEVSRFKSALDSWLMDIPDEPLVTGYTSQKRTESNSVRHMAGVEAAGHGHLEGY